MIQYNKTSTIDALGKVVYKNKETVFFVMPYLIKDNGATNINGPLTLVHFNDLNLCRKQVL